jgi:hypothetical protein
MVPVSWFYSYSDHAIALLLLSALAISTFAIRKGPILLGHFNFIDSSWALQIAFNSHHGVWLGRDVWFTYGPLFEWILGSCAWLHGWSVGAFFKYGCWLAGSFIIAATWLVSVLLLRGQPAWKRVFYIFALVVFWMYWDVRPLTDVLLFAVSVHECERLRRARIGWLRGLCFALLLSLAFLISADTGAYSWAAFLIVSLSWRYWGRSEAGYYRRVLRFAIGISAAVVVWTFLIGIVLTGTFGLDFWKTNIAILEGYRWAMSCPMQAALSARFFVVLGIVLVVFVLGWAWRDAHSRTLARHPAYIVSAMLFSVVMLQSSLVRADLWHVFFGLFPGVMLAGGVLMGADTDSRGTAWQHIPVLAALALTALFSPAPNPRFVPSILAQNVALYRLPALQTCPPGRSYLDDACFLDADYDRIHTVANYIETHSAPTDWVAVFPYQNIYGIAANRRVAGGILQNYQATGDYLTARQIAGLEAESPPLAVYSVDGMGSGGIDLVPNLTRSPQVWLYLHSRYEAATEPSPGVLILRRNLSRQQRWTMQSVDLKILQGARNAPIRWNTLLQVATGISWPGDADLLKLTVEVQYPVWWHLLKPRHLQVGLRFADGSEKKVFAIAVPNRPSDILIYPWSDSDLGNYFSTDESAWRIGKPRTALQSLWIMPYGRDVFSVDPTRIRVDRLQAVKMSLTRQR